MHNLLSVLFTAARFTSETFGAPRAESAEECGIAAGMAVVAQSLALEEIHPPKAAAIMARIYDAAQSERHGTDESHSGRQNSPRSCPSPA